MPFASYLQTYVNLYSKLKYSAIEVHINKSSWCGTFKRDEELTWICVSVSGDTSISRLTKSLALDLSGGFSKINHIGVDDEKAKLLDIGEIKWPGEGSHPDDPIYFVEDKSSREPSGEVKSNDNPF